METISFWIWFIVVFFIASIGLGSMISAYWGKGSIAIVFPDSIAADPVPTLVPAAATQFQQGCEAYQSGKYRRSVSYFTQAVQLDPQLAVAYHNRGRAVANLRRVAEAVANLVKASELYLEQGSASELAALKQDLAVLKELRDQQLKDKKA